MSPVTYCALVHSQPSFQGNVVPVHTRIEPDISAPVNTRAPNASEAAPSPAQGIVNVPCWATATTTSTKQLGDERRNDETTTSYVQDGPETRASGGSQVAPGASARASASLVASR